MQLNITNHMCVGDFLTFHFLDKIPMRIIIPNTMYKKCYENRGAIMYCSNCGKELADGSMFCNYCGTKQIVKKVCSSCGTELPFDAVFCHICGTKLTEKVEMPISRFQTETRVTSIMTKVKGNDVEGANDEIYDYSDDIDESDVSDTDDFVIENGVLLQYTGTATNVYIPDGVSKINAGVFNGYTGITKVVFPEGMSSIGERAFSACQNLKKIVFNSGIRTIEEYAFYMCGSLEEINVPETITCINKGIFADCSSLRSVKLSGGLKIIKDLAFDSCKNLKQLYIPKSVLRISSNAFRGCDNIILQVQESSRAEAFASDNHIRFEYI